MGALLVGAAILILIAWRLLRGYVRGQWSGLSDSSPWQLFGQAPAQSREAACCGCCGPSLSTSRLEWVSVSRSWQSCS
jgi:hypothetical protein